MSVTFTSQALQNQYNATNDSVLRTTLLDWRTVDASEEYPYYNPDDTQTLYFSAAELAAQYQTQLDNLESRIANFEKVLIGDVSTSGASSEDFPYDRAGLKREFLQEVYSILLSRSNSGWLKRINNNINNGTYIDVLNNGTVRDVDVAAFNNALDITGTLVTINGVTVLDSQTDAQRNSTLSAKGQSIYTYYSNLIDAVFAEGDKLAKNPSDPVTGSAVITAGTSAISSIVYDGSIYDHVGVVNNFTSLLAAGAPVYTAQKVTVLDSGHQAVGSTVDLAGDFSQTARYIPLYQVGKSISETRNGVTYNQAFTLFDGTYVQTVQVGATGLYADVTNINGTELGEIIPLTITPSDAAAVETLTDKYAVIGYLTLDSTHKYFLTSDRTTLIPESSVIARYNSSGQVTGTATIASIGAPSLRSMNPIQYLYYWMEARVRILKGQLAYKEGITTEIQADLKDANDAMADLQKVSAGLTQTNSDGTVNGTAKHETFAMDLFEARASTAGKPLFDSTGYDDASIYSEWQNNQTSLKSYIDRKSAQAQEATLDYQQVLNRFNNAYEVMAKIQEKFDDLLKAQLRNYNG